MNANKNLNASTKSGVGFSRRQVLRMGTAGAALLTSGGISALLGGCRPMTDMSALAPGATQSSPAVGASAPDLELALTATATSAQLLPGSPTQLLHYAAELIAGDAAALETLDGYLGPIIRVRRGQKVRIHFHNALDEETVIHWHGLIVPEAMDGHPRFAIEPGQTYLYEFEVQNRAGMYWFHPHPHGRTGSQVYRGLAGLFIVSDDEEEALGLPTGAYDIPLVIQDRLFDGENQLIYWAADAAAEGGMRGHRMGGMMQGGMDAMMAQMMGQRGDRILVNGQVDASLSLATRAYRLRLLNGSNARIYKFAWSDSTPLTVIGTDGGLLPEPIQKAYVTLAPGERVDLWADFSDYPVGTERQLTSLAFSGVEMGMMGGMMGGMAADPLPSGAPFPVFTAHIAQEAQETHSLPQRLTPIEPLHASADQRTQPPYEVILSMREMQWTLNGRIFGMTDVAEDERMPLGVPVEWTFVNRMGDGMMADFMAHPMHIHGVQFQVVERQIDPTYRADWQTLADGFVDAGWKDTVLVMPGERVKVIMRFSEPGLFVYHCHILEHEDMGMMRNVQVMG